jgi:hypothetical protein
MLLLRPLVLPTFYRQRLREASRQHHFSGIHHELTKTAFNKISMKQQSWINNICSQPGRAISKCVSALAQVIGSLFNRRSSTALDVFIHHSSFHGGNAKGKEPGLWSGQFWSMILISSAK